MLSGSSLEARREKARVLATLILRRLLLVVFVLCAAVVLLACGLNHLGHKYTRVVVKKSVGLEVENRYGAGAGSELIMTELEVEAEGGVPANFVGGGVGNGTAAAAAAAAAASSSSSSSGGSGSSSGGGKGASKRFRRNLAIRNNNSSSNSGGATVAVHNDVVKGELTAAGNNSASKGRAEGGCKRQVLATNLPGSVMCCDSALRHSDWVCVAAFDRFNKVLSSTWAYLIPLVPWALSAALDSSATSAHARRLGLYVFIFAVRTILLYKALGWLQAMVQPAPGSGCWYAQYTKGNTCASDNFDFSDHIVLYVANYLVPAVIEAAYSYTSFLTSGGSQPWLRCFPVAAASLLMTMLTLRGVLFTCMFFHTPLESVVGFAISTVTVLLPLYLLAGTNFWHNASITLLQNSKTPTAAA